ALGPADFGTFAVLAASVGLIGSLAEGGLTEAAVLRISAIWPDKSAEAEQRARAFLWLRLGLAAVVVAVGCLAAGPLAQRVLNTDAGCCQRVGACIGPTQPSCVRKPGTYCARAAGCGWQVPSRC